ncbi:20893_t:CDS:2, partial [Gigaspora rosea]
MTAQMGWRTSQKAGWRQSIYEESLDNNVVDVLNGTALAAISKRNENRMSYFGILSYYEQTDDEGIIEILTTTNNDSTSEKPRIDKSLLQQEAKMYALIVLGIAIMNGITAHAKYYLLERASEQWSIRLRHLGFGKVLRQPQSWFDAPDHAVGKIVTILVNDTDTAKNLIGRFIGNMTYGLVSLLGGMIWAFAIGWQLTL